MRYSPTHAQYVAQAIHDMGLADEAANAVLGYHLSALAKLVNRVTSQPATAYVKMGLLCEVMEALQGMALQTQGA